jgi:predicted ribosomally synthesized peptide with SipW-like signal peptide
MKKVLLSLFTIAVVGTLITGGAVAYFHDTETAKNNVFESGTIDFTMTGDDGVPVEIILQDMKPCDWEYYLIALHNEGTNDGPLYLHFDVVKSYNIPPRSEPERKAEQGTPVDDIENWITVDLALCDEQGNVEYVIIPPESHVKLGDLDCLWIPLGWFGGDYCTYKYLLLSFHLQAETGNEYQGDGVKFTIETHMTDHNSPGGPNPIALFLENKTDPGWDPIVDGMWGLLTFNPQGSTFDYLTTLNAYGLQSNTEYALIYYADPWPNTDGVVIGLHTTDANGDIIGAMGNPELNMDIPVATDDNYPTGGKIWLIPSADLKAAAPTVGGSAEMKAWNQAMYLYEMELIKYDDTDV